MVTATGICDPHGYHAELRFYAKFLQHRSQVMFGPQTKLQVLMLPDESSSQCSSSEVVYEHSEEFDAESAIGSSRDCMHAFIDFHMKERDRYLGAHLHGIHPREHASCDHNTLSSDAFFDASHMHASAPSSQQPQEQRQENVSNACGFMVSDPSSHDRVLQAQAQSSIAHATANQYPVPRTLPPFPYMQQPLQTNSQVQASTSIPPLFQTSSVQPVAGNGCAPEPLSQALPCLEGVNLQLLAMRDAALAQPPLKSAERFLQDAGSRGATAYAHVNHRSCSDPASAQLCADTQAAATVPLVPGQPAAAPEAAHAGHGNRSQGSDGTAAHVSADGAERGSEETETGVAAPAALQTRPSTRRKTFAEEEGPPGVPPGTGPNYLVNMRCGPEMSVSVPAVPAPATSVATDRAVVPSEPVVCRPARHQEAAGTAGPPKATRRIEMAMAAAVDTSTAMASEPAAAPADPPVFMPTDPPRERLHARCVALSSVGALQQSSVPPLLQPAAEVPEDVPGEEQQLSEDNAPQADADMHNNDPAPDGDDDDAMNGSVDEDDADMHAAVCDTVPPVRTTQKHQNVQGGRQRATQSAQTTTQTRNRTRSAPCAREPKSADELSLSHGEAPPAPPASHAPRSKNRKLISSAAAGPQPSGGADMVTGVASGSRRSATVPSAQRTRSSEPAELEADDTSKLCREGTNQEHRQMDKGKAKGSGQQARNKRRATTGAEPEPELAADARQNVPDEEGGNDASDPVSKGARMNQELKKLMGGVEVITSKRARVPPTAFLMKQMGGQNEPLPPSHEEKVRQQEDVPAHLLLPSDDSEDDQPSKKKSKTVTGNARGRSKSAGQPAGDRGGKQRRGGSVGAVGRPRKDKGADQNDAIFGDEDMLKLPGIARLKAQARDQPVAKPCPPIPSEDFVEDREAIVPDVPSVDEVHTKIAAKLEVRAQRPDFRKFIQKILDNNPSLGECGSRVLRLKPTLDLDTSFFEIEMVLEALRYNWRVEALYIHNFEHGFCDKQLDTLISLLSLGRIWACNVGENFLVSGIGWRTFHKSLYDTSLAFTYVSEAHLQRLADLKVLMRAAIRLNRILSPRREPDVCKHISNMWFNPSGPTARRHYGCASITQIDQCAANAAPLAEIVAERTWEVETINCTKNIYGEFVQVRDTLIKEFSEQVKRKALDPRAFDAASRNASRTGSAALSSNMSSEELRPVRTEYKTGAKADARHEEDSLLLKDKEQRHFWKSHPRTRFIERDLTVVMLELPEPVRARLGLSADGGPGCSEATGSNTATGTNGNGVGENAGNIADGSGALTNGAVNAEIGDGSGASNSENPLQIGAGPISTNGAEDVNGTNGGAGSSSGIGAVVRNGGNNISAANAAAEKAQRGMIRDGDLRMKEVARGVEHLEGVSAVMRAVGSKEVQARWADPRRIRACDPYDFGNDVLAWASKAVGGNVTARRAAADGLGELVGQRIDVFLPMFVMWVGATVEETLEDDKDVAVVTFWNGGKAQLRLLHSLVAWRLSKKQEPLPPGQSLEPHTSSTS